MEDKRILVIGGTGYIGKEVCSELLKRGYFVSVLSRKLKESDKVKVLNGSVLDKGFLEPDKEVVKKTKVERVSKAKVKRTQK